PPPRSAAAGPPRAQSRASSPDVAILVVHSVQPGLSVRDHHLAHRATAVFTSGQSGHSDRHVYASRTQFLSVALLPLFDHITWPAVELRRYFVGIESRTITPDAPPVRLGRRALSGSAGCHRRSDVP